jgi:hypothetical protein
LESTLPEYEEKALYLDRQLQALVQAEREVDDQISEWDQKKSRQVETLINSRAKLQLEEVDKELKAISEPLKKLLKELEENKTKLKQLDDEFSSEETVMIERIVKEKNRLEELNAEYEQICVGEEKETYELKKINDMLNKTITEHEDKIKELNTKLEDAKESYNAAKDAELNSSKLSQYNTSRIKKLSKELTLPSIIHLPLQQSNCAIKAASNQERVESPTTRTQCSSNVRNPQNSIDSLMKAANKGKVKGSQRYNHQVYTKTARVDALEFPVSSQNRGECWNDKWLLPEKELTHEDSKELDISCLFNSSSDRPSSIVQLRNQLLNGHDFYKKFSTKYSARLPIFDPLKAELCPPSHCGYGLRHLSLTADLSNILISTKGGESGDLAIPIRSVVKPLIPHKTAEIIRAQKAARGMPEQAMTNMEYIDCAYYPFAFELEGKGKLELIATNYKDLKLWVISIGILTKNKKLDEMISGKEIY